MSWVAQAFTVNTDSGQSQVAGWVSGLFALDFRVWNSWDEEFDEDRNDRGWVLTHLPTGFMAAGILAPLEEAKTIADRIIGLADWSFSDPAESKSRGSLLLPLRKELEGKLIFRAATYSPLFRAEA